MKKIKQFVKYLYSCFQLKKLAVKKDLKTSSKNISFRARYGEHVSIGKNVIISDDCSIGSFTYINQNSSIEKAHIGKYCSISEGVHINPVNHNLKLVSTHPFVGNNGHYALENETVTIGNDVLISINAIILSGVHIDNGAVIGAGAVVTHDVPPYAIVAGVPAKIIGYRFEKEKIDALQALQWWDWQEEKVQRNIPFFRNETRQIG